MPTDDERRAVARRLRRSRSEWSGMGWRLWLGPKFCAVVLSDGNRDELEDAAHLLADLIEPSGHECVPGECPINVRNDNDRIDRGALLALADILGSTGEMDCRGCRLEGAGCAECSSGVAHEAARRIRKALGVEPQGDSRPHE